MKQSRLSKKVTSSSNRKSSMITSWRLWNKLRKNLSKSKVKHKLKLKTFKEKSKPQTSKKIQDRNTKTKRLTSKV